MIFDTINQMSLLTNIFWLLIYLRYAKLYIDLVWSYTNSIKFLGVLILCVLCYHSFQPSTVQCVLPINLWNEKIFLFLWYWLVLVSTITCLNFIVWVYKALFRKSRESFVKKYLKCSSRYVTIFICSMVKSACHHLNTLCICHLHIL